MRERSEHRANVYPLDVRQVSEYVESHIPGSIAVPGGLAIQRTDEFVPVRAGRIVLIDRLEARAWLTAYWLCRMGFSHVHVLAGGIAAWAEGGGTVEPGRGRSRPAGWESAQRLTRYVTPGELQRQIRDALLLNVDTSRQFETARLPGSRWIRYGDLEDHMAGWPDAHRAHTVLSCRDGTLSTLAAANLARAGMDGVRVLAGGVEAWRKDGYEVEKGGDAQSQAAEDLVIQPYDSGREGMQRYLDWEQKLTARDIR